VPYVQCCTAHPTDERETHTVFDVCALRAFALHRRKSGKESYTLGVTKRDVRRMRPPARLQYHISLRALAGAFCEMWTGERLFCGAKDLDFTNLAICLTPVNNYDVIRG